MTKWLMAGTALLVAGLLKIWQHTNAPMTLEDYLAFRCGSASGAAGDSFLTFAGHCWGCPVAAIGAAMVAYSAVMIMASSRRQALAVRR
ncbi:hypothetical protein [Hyphomonas sp.]|uniref:hypothetical protein n=1 Tax=Hyphomonas sp. TaxID=87 RepID=UPI000C411276|nr:hypothetical protein [Hyphomonas sp.]MAB10539.1 hypothetical protein [Hyphomonas sp.]MAU66844.1 hypothetical protein [Hyphomonas sp.]MBM58118.1 hypothetical protein [Hyphomonas sp.]